MIRKSKKLSANIFLSLTVFVFCFFIVEIVLRFMGYQSGMLSPNWLNFKAVDTLIVYPSFHTNNKGIFVADKEFFKNEYYINEDGFRSHEFIKDSTRKNILFLGDSYTWGSMASPINKCFVELVEKGGYNVFNTGIPGADPPQYYAIAKDYVSRLKPEIVCLMFYAGNDFISQDRKVEPYKNLFHITNAGWFNPYINNEYVESPEKVYNYYYQKYHIGKDAPFWERIVAKSVVGTLLLGIPMRLEERNAWQKNTSLAVRYIEAINRICIDNNAKFYLFLIPLHTEISQKMYKDYAFVFSPIKVNIPEDITKSDFLPWPNGHLTNEGHAKYAKYILKTIDDKK